MVADALARDGYATIPFDGAVAAWAQAAHALALQVLQDGSERRHGGTWFVGVDALPNAGDGSINGVPLAGDWLNHVTPAAQWHQAQLSAVFPGYPQQDADESDAAHRFRLDRDAAHVDGVLPEGPGRRRHLREPNGFIAGFPLNDVAASPLVVWASSHHLIRSAFVKAFEGLDPDDWANLDVTDIYQVARRSVFATCQRVEIRAKPGEVILLHRHLLHGVAPWGTNTEMRPRMIAYFRPTISFAAWL